MNRLSRYLFVLLVLASVSMGLTGCKVLLPDTVRPEFEHMSHLTQHQPFTDHPQSCGSNVVNVVAHWDMPKRFFLEVGEGVALDRYHPYENTAVNHGVGSYGELIGPNREQFTARIGYTFKVPK